MPENPGRKSQHLSSEHGVNIIQLTNCGKRFNRDWIFRNVNYRFSAGKSYAITGPNGSGKSTLLQIITGAIAPSEGKVEYGIKQGTNETGKSIPEIHHSSLITEHLVPDSENVYQYISVAAPYLEVIEEMTAIEFLKFHTSFKPLFPSISFEQILELTGLQDAAHKQIRFYSSGMKQRIKLAQAIFSDVPVLLLDEPCTNLDAAGYALYHRLVEDYCKEKLVIVSSNDVQEYDFCEERISIPDFK